MLAPITKPMKTALPSAKKYIPKPSNPARFKATNFLAALKIGPAACLAIAISGFAPWATFESALAEPNLKLFLVNETSEESFGHKDVSCPARTLKVGILGTPPVRAFKVSRARLAAQFAL